MAERDLIEHIRRLAARSTPPWLEVGIGDDAAVARLPGGARIVATCDMVIEGVHFQPGAPPAAIGRKAVARALSDLAAMAARPLCALTAVNFGAQKDTEWMKDLTDALWRACAQFGAPLVGGDIAGSAGPICVTVTAIGLPGPAGIVRRSGARPGDRVCVTGALGGSISGGRHLRFTPRLREAIQLAERFDIHAMIDVSDGLSTDLLHIAEESGVGMELEAEAIPVHPDALAGGGGGDPVRRALEDGEDYELVFCTCERDATEAARTGVLGTPVSIIGRVRRGRRSLIVWPDGRRQTLKATGWEHLKP